MDEAIKQASGAHEKLMMNLAVFHLLLPVAALSTGYMLVLLAVSMIGSIGMISWIYWNSHRTVFKDELTLGHWQLAWKRCRLLMLAYVISGVILLIGAGLGSLQPDPNMSTIMLVVFSRIAAVPTVLMVLILFVLETTALSQARQGIKAG